HLPQRTALGRRGRRAREGGVFRRLQRARGIRGSARRESSSRHVGRLAQGRAALGTNLSAETGVRSSASTVAGPLCARFHAALAPRASDAEIAWYRERIPRGAGACLELMCGYGRLLVPLAEAGFNIHGVDWSSSMLAQCESRLADAALAAPLC